MFGMPDPFVPDPFVPDPFVPDPFMHRAFSVTETEPALQERRRIPPR